jgi:protease secretion system outer membrane protein
VDNLRFRKRALAGIAAAMLMACGGSASALGLLDAYQAALVHDPAFQSATQEYLAGQENKILGRSLLLPNVSASYANSKNRADVEAQNILGNKSLTHPEYTSVQAVLQLRQALFNMDSWARYKQGLAQTDYATAIFESRRQELIVRVATAYTDALFATEQLRLAEVQRDMYVEQQKVNNQLFERGEGTKTDMLETQARLDLSEALVLEAQDNVQTANSTLSAMVGQEVVALDDLNPAFNISQVPLGSLEDWKATALAESPDIQSQRYAVESAHQEVNKAKAGHAPRLDFVASYSKNKANTVDTYDQDSTVRSIGIQLNVPLYSGGQVNASTRQAVATQEKAKADMQVTTDKVLIELRKQYAAVLSSAAKIRALEKAVSSGELLIQATGQSIKGGVRINLDLLNAQQQLYTSKRDLAQARYNYLVSSLRLKSAAGKLDDDALRAMAVYFR